MGQGIFVDIGSKLTKLVTVFENAPQGDASHVMHSFIQVRAKLCVELGFGNQAANAFCNKVVAHEGEKALQISFEIGEGIRGRYKRGHTAQGVLRKSIKHKICF